MIIYTINCISNDEVKDEIVLTLSEYNELIQHLNQKRKYERICKEYCEIF